MSRTVHRLARWQRRLLLWTGNGLLGSGAAWLALHYLVGAGAAALPHPLEAWLMRLHGLASFGALFMLGVLAAAHVPRGWRLSARGHRAPQRFTGIALCALGAVLASSAYLLYYFAPEFLRPALGWAHAAVGAAMAVLAVLHAHRYRA